MKSWCLQVLVCALSVVLLSATQMQKAFGLDVVGLTVGSKPTLITSLTDVIPGSVKTPAVFKVRIRVNTNGKALRLCLGSQSDYFSGACPQRVAFSSRDSTGQPKDGLGVVDTIQLLGKLLYIKNVTSGAPPNDLIKLIR